MSKAAVVFFYVLGMLIAYVRRLKFAAMIRGEKVSADQYLLFQVASTSYFALFFLAFYENFGTSLMTLLIAIPSLFLGVDIFTRLLMHAYPLPGKWVEILAVAFSIPFVPFYFVFKLLLKLIYGKNWIRSYPGYAIEEARRLIFTDEHNRRLVEGILRLTDKRAKDIMVPRIDMVCVPSDTSIEELAKIMTKTGHSRIPVFSGSIDEIKGFVYVKDILDAVLKGRKKLDDKLIRDVIFVPENKRCDELLWELQEKHQQLAIVVDEYGGTAGLVTLEDVLEEIVGEIIDEYDRDEEPVVKISEKEFYINPTISIVDLKQEFQKRYGIDISFPEGDYDTLSGLIMEELGHIPKKGEKITMDSCEIEVVSAKRRRINKVLLRFLT